MNKQKILIHILSHYSDTGRLANNHICTYLAFRIVFILIQNRNT